jgi:hypothetical protein
LSHPAANSSAAATTTATPIMTPFDTAVVGPHLRKNEYSRKRGSEEDSDDEVRFAF